MTIIEATQLLERLVAWRYGPVWSKWHITAPGTAAVTLCGRDYVNHAHTVRLSPRAPVDTTTICHQCYELLREELNGPPASVGDT